MAWSLIESIERHAGLITPAEAVRLTGLSRTTVYRMIESGEIPTVQFGDTDKRVIDPKTWVYKLLKSNPMLREAHTHSKKLAA